MPTITVSWDLEGLREHFLGLWTMLGRGTAQHDNAGPDGPLSLDDMAMTGLSLRLQPALVFHVITLRHRGALGALKSFRRHVVTGQLERMLLEPDCMRVGGFLDGVFWT